MASKKSRKSRSPTRKAKASEDFVDSLFENAIDFLNTSISQIQTSPKYSVINFCAALELFLKARLLVEHWSLIVLRPETAELEKFKKGDFQSVSMGEAIRRLKNVCNEGIITEATDCFQRLRNHRNKLVHFFHPEYVNASDKTIETIVSEECKSWFYLYRLLDNLWWPHFKKHSKKIEKLNKHMHRLREFLGAKYEAIKPGIEREIKNGSAKYEKCASCGFEAARILDAEEEAPLAHSKCEVCEAWRHFLLVNCPQCEHSIRVEEMGEGECTNCRFQVDIDYLLGQFRPTQDPKEAAEIAYCSECQQTATPTAIPWENGKYLCLSCLTSHDSARNCGYCGSLCTGIDPVSASLFGCVLCEGSLALDHT